MGQINTSIDHRNNDELINMLIKGKSIRTINVEKVFRCVDRGLYFTDIHKHYAYRDAAWQSDHIHLSAPCVYATALECLELKPGNKFLNVGSGIGYLSTIAGLLLGRNGVNHGIELHQLLIDNAYQKIEEFKLSAAAIDYYDFCEPVFIRGNVCELSSVGYYDRVYCGAGVSSEKSEFMKSLIKIGGILVMPLDGILLKIIRNDEHVWDTIEILDVSFTDLVTPEKCSLNTVKFPSVEPMSLQELCRSNIRSLIRKNLKVKYPSLQMRTKCQRKSYVDIRNINHEDPLAQFIHIQYGINEIGTFNIRNIFDLFADLSDAISDSDSESDYGDIMPGLESESESTEGTERLREEIACLQEINREFTDESTKRKSQNDSCSEQSVSSTETTTENPKRMKLDSLSSQNIESVSSSTSSSSGSSESWETLSTSDSSMSLLPNNFFDDDSESWVSVDDIINREDREQDDDSSSNDEEIMGFSDPEEAREWSMYNFKNEHTENELSILLKIEINSLQIPVPLKRFLNYNRID